ncbi:MarR family transcriptional regulator [Streptomyces jumonjinensis]|uniref:MarR family transcriptional regulator n=1 Tax=Streptomyces jumonjinensis TaxID=1945 RepID=A0A646KMG5_STRJU|nr:MarR family transcriptional regulator [Streptomyces jumonjinensis]
MSTAKDPAEAQAEAQAADPAEAQPQPQPQPQATYKELLSRTALGVFRLNGQFLAVAESLARPAGLTAARWQVLGAIGSAPQSVAGIARTMGITRQSVQRIADLLVERGLAVYEPNPAHRRAKLLRATDEGLAALQRISPGHAELAARLAEVLGPEEFAETARVLERLSGALDALPGEPAAAGPDDA